MTSEDKEKKKGFFAKLYEFFNGFEGSGCACNCLKTVWEKYAEEETKKFNEGKSQNQK